MTKAKNQHYIPQSYLKRFASADSNKIHVYDKFSKNSFATNIKNVASEKYFNEMEDHQIEEILRYIQENPQQIGDQKTVRQAINMVNSLDTIEQQLSQVEGQFKTVIDELLFSIERSAEWFSHSPTVKSFKTTSLEETVNIVERLKQSEQIDPSFKPDVAFFIALQFVRTREFRHSVSEFFQESTKKISEMVLQMMGVDISQIELNTEFSLEEAKVLHLSQMLDDGFLSRIADALMEHIWTFVVNETPRPFYTSDNPVVLVPNKFAPHRHYTGYASEGIEIHFPLSPKYAIVFYERTHFANLAILDGKVIPLEDENVVYHNSVQINQSYRQVYCPLDDFELVERTCREHPEVCDQNKSRFKIG